MQKGPGRQAGALFVACVRVPAPDREGQTFGGGENRP